MEELLSPREFIKRFHLPQLVRISTHQSDQQPPPVDRDSNSTQTRNESANQAPRNGQPRRPEQRDLGWTYSSGGGGGAGDSLHFADPTRGSDTSAPGPMSLNGFDNIKPSSAAHILPRVKLSRLASESFNRTRPLNDQTFLRPTTSCSRENKIKNSKTPKFHSSPSACLDGIKLMPPSKRPTLSKLELEQPFLIYKAHRKLEICAYAADSNNQLHDKSGDPIYFPHNYQGWFSMRPPTTTATTRGAYDKNAQEAVGQQQVRPDPREHLETLDQVCQAGGQVFLTRDELVGHQLPSKLSHLTKLNNNQLLAVPLAINLNGANMTSGDDNNRSAASTAKKGRDQKKGSTGASGSGNINDLRQCIIGAGKVLRICGIYEDVLPLIEGAGSKQRNQLDLNGSKFHQAHTDQHAIQWASSGHASHYYNQQGQFPPPTTTSNQQQVVYGPSSAANQPAALARREQRLIRQQMVAPSVDLIYQNNVQQQQQQLSGQFIAAAVGQPAPVQVATGRRYARCVVLSDDSVDLITGCATPGGATSAAHKNLKCDSGAMKTDAPSPPDTEVEVLIPLNLIGRFYLCATSQTIANELQCHDCSLAAHRSAPYLAFRLSQIVYLLNVNKRLSHAAVAHSRSQHHQWRPFSSSFTLPLQVRLIMGPRPASFSPTMFGLSSTMESYFASEQNVGAHLLACKYNRTARPKSPVARSSRPPVAKQSDSAAPPSTSTPVCGCPQQVRVASCVGGCGGGLGWFSGLLRLESMAKRDVLLACTIKQSPLRHSDLIGHHLSSGDRRESTSGPSKPLKSGKTKSRRTQAGATLGPSSRVEAKSSSQLNELTGFAPSDHLMRASPAAAAAAASKSSMSRLRACRSLISLNGRRQKKKRPDIPSCMLSETIAASTRDGATGGGDFINMMGAQLAVQGDLFGLVETEHQSGESEPIVLIELDCNAEVGDGADHLRISRTFVERSLPAASIPDLVVNRMNYCQANSHLWERQLKLSQASLSRDFDSCKRQLASLMVVAGGERSEVATTEHEHELERQQEQEQLSMEQFVAGKRDQNRKHQTGGNLTASSRSSSGVSSSGEHHRARFMLADQQGQSSRLDKQQPPVGPSSLSTSSSLSNLGANSSSSPGGGGSGGGDSSTATSTRDDAAKVKVRTTPARNSRLLRLVQRILPAAKVADCRPQVAPLSAKTKHSTAGGRGCDVVSSSSSTTLSSGERRRQQRDKAASKQQLKLMEELNGRFRSKLSLMAADASNRRAEMFASADSSSSSSSSSSGAKRWAGIATHNGTSATTLMNAQKVHKRLLMTGSMRHLPSELLNRMMEDDDDGHQERPPFDFASKSCTLNNDEDDSSSHLYESLERLTASDCRLQLASSLSGGGGTSAPEQVVQQHAGRSSRLMMKIQLIKQQQQQRRRQQQQQQQQQREPLCPERAPDVVARSRPGLGFGDRQTAEAAAAAVEDEWWQRQGASSGEDEAAAPAVRATSGCASWRQRLVASVGGGAAAAAAASQQRPKFRPTRGQNGKALSLCHSMELFGEFDGDDPARQQSCSDAESCEAAGDGMEPVSIEACEQHAGQELSASDNDEPRQAAAAAAAASDRRRRRNGNRRDNDSSSSHSSFASSQASGGSSCSLTSALTGQQRRQLIGTHMADGDIYVNLIAQEGASSWTSPDELTRAAATRRTPELIEPKLEMSQRNLRLVGRMERKLAKLRGRKELPPARQASLAGMELPAGGGGEMRSLGWAPADELRSSKQRILLSNGGSGGSQSMICISMTKPAQVQAAAVATQSSGGCSSSSSSAASSLSRASSSLSPTAGGELKLAETATSPLVVVAYGNGAGGSRRNPSGQVEQHSGQPRSIVTLDRPSVVAATSAE